MAFSFGAAAQPQQQQQQQQGTPAAPAAFSFGAPKPAAPAATAPFSFGGASTSQPQQQPAAGGFSFGQSQPAAQPVKPAGFSFGAPAQPQQQQAPPAGGSTFFFGASQPAGQAPAQSLFGQSQFGQSQLGQQQGQKPQQQQQGLQAQQQQGSEVSHQPDRRLGAPLGAKMEAIRAAWDTNNIQTCRFLHYFYNNVGPSAIVQLSNLPPNFASGSSAQAIDKLNPNAGRRPDAVGPRHEALWSVAVRENPDRMSLLPVLAVGYPDLSKRIAAQRSEGTRQRARLTELQTAVDELARKHDLSNVVRARAAFSKQMELHQRVVGLARRAHTLIPALRTASISTDEERLRAVLESCDAELGGRASAGVETERGRIRAKVNELWAMLGSVKAQRELASRDRRGGSSAAMEWAVVDDAAMQDVAKILATQRQGLSHLSKTIEADGKALEVILTGIEGAPLVGVRQ